MEGSSTIAGRNRANWKRASGAAAPRRVRASLPEQGTAATSEAVDYGAQRFRERKDGRLERSVDGAPVRIQYADPRNPGIKRAKVMVQNVVDAYFTRRRISWREWKGADNLRSAWYRAGGEGLRAANIQRTRVDDSVMGRLTGDPAALAEYRQCMRDIGRDLARCIWLVVIANYSASEYARKVGLGRDDGWGVLRVALRALATSYDIPEGLNEEVRQARL